MIKIKEMKANKALYKKIYAGLNDSVFKYVTAENLSESLGIYPEIIAMAMAKFDPLIRMDTEANLMKLLPELELYLNISKRQPVEEGKPVKPHLSFSDFVYEKMTVGGIVDKAIVLSEDDLRLASSLIQEELNRRKK
jgi:hypothetical protein